MHLAKPDKAEKAAATSGEAVDLAALKDLQKTLLDAVARVDLLRQRAQDKLRELQTLEAGGVDFARPVYQGGYLYRHAPADDTGRRRRFYVGAEATAKAAKARAAMDRGLRYKNLNMKLTALVRTATGAQHLAVQLFKRLDAAQAE